VTRDSSGAALCHKVGAGAQVTHGGPEAALSRWGTWRLWCCPELREHVTVPELPRAGSESCCLNFELVRGGTWSSGYRHRYLVEFMMICNNGFWICVVQNELVGIRQCSMSWGVLIVCNIGNSLYIWRNCKKKKGYTRLNKWSCINEESITVHTKKEESITE
jgi:hypothetical protein